jgi:hypothetical protein
MTEKWEELKLFPDGKLHGDCDCFCFSVGNDLEKKGYIWVQDLRLCVCKTAKCPSNYEYDHCILLIKNNDEWLVSDCNHQDITYLSDLPYTNYFWHLGAIDGEWVGFDV